MEKSELTKMRKTQFLVTNGLIMVMLIGFILFIGFIDVTPSLFFLTLGIILLIQGGVGLARSDSTKSIFPIFEKVARYEKEKMGSEWKKQRRMSAIWNLILSILMVLQFFMYRDSSDPTFDLSIIFIIMVAIFTVGLVNISMFFHVRKIDRSHSTEEFKGYTWKINIIGIGIGIFIALVVITAVTFYLISII